MNIRSLQNIACLCLVTVIGLRELPALAEEEILAGRSAAGQLKVNIDFFQPLVLEASVFPGISGYATGELGFHSTILDDAANDFFQLSTAADFRFILLAKDAGMEVWNDTGSGYMGINDTFYIGPAPFDTHPIWNIVSGTPGNVYLLTLKVHDVNGVYPDSAPFTLSFTPVQILYQINLEQIDPAHAALLWTTNAAGWDLESTDSLAGTNWVAIPPPAIVGTNYSLSIIMSEPHQFFRLHKR